MRHSVLSQRKLEMQDRLMEMKAWGESTYLILVLDLPDILCYHGADPQFVPLVSPSIPQEDLLIEPTLDPTVTLLLLLFLFN